eukprot:7448339-Pyramimonas_sp.AAC.1
MVVNRATSRGVRVGFLAEGFLRSGPYCGLISVRTLHGVWTRATSRPLVRGGALTLCASGRSTARRGGSATLRR